MSSLYRIHQKTKRKDNNLPLAGFFHMNGIGSWLVMLQKSLIRDGQVLSEPRCVIFRAYRRLVHMVLTEYRMDFNWFGSGQDWMVVVRMFEWPEIGMFARAPFFFPVFHETFSERPSGLSINHCLWSPKLVRSMSGAYMSICWSSSNCWWTQPSVEWLRMAWRVEWNIQQKGEGYLLRMGLCL